MKIYKPYKRHVRRLIQNYTSSNSIVFQKRCLQNRP
uniref:Uncharacterized protein n=1 Tax=Amphimedon queenslandica TaxID=400682 RepID=A0A1X7V6D7_AMPQE